MAFDGLTAKSVCNELDCLIGGKITKIFEPNKNEIILGVYSNSSNYALNISIDSSLYRLNLTTYNKPNPQNVLGFCMVLRKHLTNGIIKNIYMNGFERIVYIDILTKNDLNDLTCKTLVVELMGKHSNIILLNEFQTVIDSLRHLNRFDNSNRDIFPGSKYASINNHKFEFSKTIEDFSRNIFDCNISQFSLSTAISTIYNGFSKNNLLALFDHININDEDNSYSNLKVVFDYLSNLTASLLSGGTNNKLLEYSLKNKKDYFIASCETQSNLDVNFKLDNFYHQKEISDKFQQYKNLILKLVLNQISKLKNKIKNIDSKISECSNMDEYKLYGELLTSNLYRLSNIPIAEVSLENYYDKNNLITIPLDSKFSPAQNAKIFFKKYKKSQSTLSIVQKQKEEVLNELAYLDSIIFEIDTAKTLDELDSIYLEINDNLISSKFSNTVASNMYSSPDKTTKNKKEKNTSSLAPAKYIIDGYTVLVGKNNKQNDYLTCKIAKNQDIWFHTKDIHGCHVVLQNSNSKESPIDISKTQIPPTTLYKCACLAAYFSKAKLSQNVPVDYTYIKYVKKPNNAKLGMVIYTNNKTIYANPDSNFRNLQ